MENEMVIEEIESEWVLIEEPLTDEALNILRGTVVHHSKDRYKVYGKAVS